MGESPASIDNRFPVNAIRVGDGIVLINVFHLDPDQAEAFVATQVGEYKRLQGVFPGSLSANLHLSLDRTRAVNYAHFSSVDTYLAMRDSPAFAEHLLRLKGLVRQAEPQLYSVIYTQAADQPISDEPLPPLADPAQVPSLGAVTPQ
ncbi:antibiotic biosynthesis monooxygenase [Cyanobium sp. Morenito 9A2]|uniref:antibiotic biosynthesis monooxygenase n=1 Tax=Cyanobium sp. Morenito 9A2 TaxID=2823718 RepID=UPI0020CE3EA7|nr:antibiotic biosynthesis monooxygenase [Cyanobium sp. Morenito 9A2]MCP9850382.1 antibiotic biosynthesis monooxygenase [Cyanobium sp. Morenito 9A2]